MRFNADFIKILKDYGRLPITSIVESLEVIRENEELQERFDHLRKTDDAKRLTLDSITKAQKQRELDKKERELQDQIMQSNADLQLQLTQQAQVND